MTTQQIVLLHNGEKADKAAVDTIYAKLVDFIDKEVPSLLYPATKSDYPVDSPIVREGALYHALNVLNGAQDAVTKPILIELLCAKGFFTSDNHTRLTAADVADELTKNVLLSAVRGNGIQNQITLGQPYLVAVPTPA